MFVEMAGSLTRRAFFMVVFLNFLHPDCSKRSFFQSRLVGNSGLKENVKCDTKQINKEEELIQLTGFFELDARQNSPIDRVIAPAGTNFTYECCGESEFKAIFKWGLFEKGVLSPSRLFSRVEINMDGNSCTVSWTTDPKASKYVGRTSVEYNKTSHCVLWITPNVTMEDDNTFVAVYRDNFTLGVGFKVCTPLSLNVSKAATPTRPLTQPTQRPAVKTPRQTATPTRPLTQPTQTPAVKTPRQKASSTAPELSTTTPSKHPSHTPSGPTLSNKKIPVILWIALAVLGVLILTAVFFIIKWVVKKYQRRRRRESGYQIRNEEMELMTIYRHSI